MGLARPVRGVAAVGPAYELEPLDQVPPETIQVAPRIGVHRAFEAADDKRPADEDQQLPAAMLPDPRDHGVHALPRRSRELNQPPRIVQPLRDQHGDRLRERAVRRPAEEVGEGAVDVERVHRVTHLVQHRADRAQVVAQVGQDAYVAFGVDVHAERVLLFPLAFEQIAPRKDRIDRQADGLETPLGEIDRIDLPGNPAHIEVRRRRKILEEGVVVMPRTQRVRRDPEPSREVLVDFLLDLGKRVARTALEVVENLVEPLGIQFVERQAAGVEVRVPLVARRLVAETNHFPQPPFDPGAYLLGRLPVCAPLFDAVGGPHQVDHVVEPYRPPADFGPEVRELGVEIRPEFHHPFEVFGILLAGLEGQAKEVDLPGKERFGFRNGGFPRPQRPQGVGVREHGLVLAGERLDALQMLLSACGCQEPTFFVKLPAERGHAPGQILNKCGGTAYGVRRHHAPPRLHPAKKREGHPGSGPPLSQFSRI